MTSKRKNNKDEYSDIDELLEKELPVKEDPINYDEFDWTEVVKLLESDEYRFVPRADSSPWENPISKLDELIECPDCSSVVIPSAHPIIQTEGVGSTFSQRHIASFSVYCDVVCTACGTTWGHIVQNIDQY